MSALDLVGANCAVWRERFLRGEQFTPHEAHNFLRDARLLCEEARVQHAELARLRAENERMRGEIITYQDAHTTGTEIIDELRAKVEALEAELAYVDVCHACECVMMPSLQLCESCVLHGDEDLVEEARYAYEQGHRVSAARKGGE